MMRQLDNINSQVNPHFLFNSLNNLSALTHKDPEGAYQFVQELSSVYHYMFKVNDMQLVILEEELSFLRSYAHLLDIRHGEGFLLHTEIDSGLLDYKLPPLTLQLLIENAVKHNKVLHKQPLRVQVHTNTAGKLVVSNNLQRKTSGVQSTKMGLKNIAKKISPPEPAGYGG
jgi:LytS/YehU family sensor histidine kinase